MARKIKFALEMANGVKVRTDLAELKENFDMEKAVGYFLSGKLIEWLEDRYYDEEAEKLRTINKDAPDLNRQICAALGVEYEGEDELDVEQLERLNEKKAILRQKTSDGSIIDNAAKTALNQEDLADLLDMDEPVIYLCGDSFNIPVRVGDKKYIGILGTPKVAIQANSQADLDAKGIVFENVVLPWGEAKTETNKTTAQVENIVENIVGKTVFYEKYGYGKVVEQTARNFTVRFTDRNCVFSYDDIRKSVEFRDNAQINDVAEAGNSIKDDLKAIFYSLWDTEDKWNITTNDWETIKNNPTSIEKKMYLNFVCRGQYNEEDIIHIHVTKDMSAGWAFTTDSFCIAGGVEKYANNVGLNGLSTLLLNKSVWCINYRDIEKVNIDLCLDEESSANVIKIHIKDYSEMTFNCYYMMQKYHIEFDRHEMYCIGRYLEVASSYLRQ